MRGRPQKDPALRQRRNKPVGGAGFDVDIPPRKRAPTMPKREDGLELHKMTCAWWHAVWHSPMAAEYLDADIPALCRLALLIDDYWRKPTTLLAAEIRQQQTHFGLTPLDRMRLRWEIKRVETATKTPARSQPTKPADDPRKLFSVV